ncbi:family 43 glycosylhydrolase [Flavobacterium sp. LT1R49]|uniref:family 43 glycosylhydrolase n=1 Tax=Flavobacterium arabinosi TaxID=3398737 RepID=UPI003A84DBB1
MIKIKLHSNSDIKYCEIRQLILLLLLFSCFVGYSQDRYKRPKSNPIIPDMIADPSIVKIDGVYYCYATTDGYDKGLSTAGPPVIWKSNDFLNWTLIPDFFPSVTNMVYVAPSKVIKFKDQFYFYPTLNREIFAAVADTPQGPFRLVNNSVVSSGNLKPKPLVPIKGPKGTKGIDAEVFVDDDGQSYLFWAQRGAARLKEDRITLDTITTVIPTKRLGYSEGPIVFKRKGIYYYLYTLEGDENYKYAYGYCKNSPLGPYFFPENDIIATTDTLKKIYGPGHGTVFSEPETDNYYFAYLEFGNGSTNRQVWVDKLTFNNDGTIKPVVLSHEGVGALTKSKKLSNLVVPKQVSTSSNLPDLIVQPIKDSTLKRTENYSPVNAIDGSNGTRWMADSTDVSAWYQVDLGSVIKIKKAAAYFSKPTAGHAYKLEYSQDGIRWKVCGGHAAIKVQSPHMDLFSIKARFLKLTFLSGVPGLWEFKVYNN